MNDDRPDRLTLEISEQDMGWIVAALNSFHDQARSNPGEAPFRFLKPDDLERIRDLWRRSQERLDIHRGYYDERYDAVAYWVTSVRFSENRGRNILDGDSFARELEWVPEPGPPRLFAWKGEVRITLEGAGANYVHRSGSSWAWEVVGAERFPEPPFLLTDQSTCRPIYRGFVEVRLSAWDDAHLTEGFLLWMKTQGWRTVPVIGDGWFGMIRIEAGDPSRGFLEAFSKEDIKLSTGDEVTTRWAHEEVEFGRFRIETPR